VATSIDGRVWMRVPTLRRLPTRARVDAEKYLLPGEEAVVVTRRHWAVLIEPTARFVPGFVVGLVVLLLDPDNQVTSSAGILIVLAALVAYALRITEWWMRHFIVSRRRVLLTSGVLVRTVTLLPLARITDLTWRETPLGQLLGYGTFRFESAGQEQALRHLTYLPDARTRYRQVSQLLFSKDHGAAIIGDDEGNPQPPLRGPQARHDTVPIPLLPFER
jgi:membrane protein YdbS with pleckstrin-like domain